MIPLFDAHLHIIDPRFPLVENQGFLPDPFPCQDYLAKTKHLNVRGGAIVSGSFQAFDQSYLIDALKTFGPSFIGVTQLPYDTSDEELITLAKLGVRAVRFNVKRGGSENISRLEYFARRVYELAGWHVELYIESKSLPELSTVLQRLPAVSIDHLGLTRGGFPTLLKLAEKGVRVKATGFGRVEMDVKEALLSIFAANPDALMFGTDLPSTRAPRPFEDSDIALIYETLGDQSAVEKVLYQNAVAWYKPTGLIEPN